MPRARAGVALVGCGYWGRNLARNLHQMGRLAAVCDPSPEVLAGLRTEYPGLRLERRFERLLERPAVRALAIAAPAAQHYELASRALAAGKDVFVEKPLALRVSEAEELVAQARRGGRVLMVGHLLEYHPAIRELHKLVAAGELGRIHYVYSTRANLGKVRREENILWSFAPHDVSVILLLLGVLPESAQTSGQHYLQHDVADVTLTFLSFPGRARAHIFVSWLHPFKEQKLVVIGSRRMAVFDDVVKEGKLRLFDKGIEWKDGLPVVRQTAESTLFFPESEPLREELLHFVDCIETRRTPRTDGRSGLRVLRVLEACQRSLEAGGMPMPLEPGRPRATRVARRPGPKSRVRAR
jgi:UDP-2-acetamido-3-amino-2,3-dideoxy-glucuronate N-acetyltransferase